MIRQLYKKNRLLANTNLILTRCLNTNTNEPRGHKTLDVQKTTNWSKTPSLAKILSNYENLKFRNFEEEVNLRRRQARQSILVRLQLKSDVKRLIEDLEIFDCSIRSVFVFNDFGLNPRTSMMAALIELARPNDVEKLTTEYVKHLNASFVPSRSRILFYRVFKTPKSVSSKLRSTMFNLNDVNFVTETRKFQNESNSISQFLSHFKDANEEMENFYNEYKIDELGYRIRYFVASVIEDSLTGLFRNCICLPFGSSSNRFGQNGADLDLSLSWDNRFGLIENFNPTGEFDQRANGALFFQTKHAINNNERYLAGINLELVEFILNSMLPRFEISQLLKNPKVPILKCKFSLRPSLECDLSMSQVRQSFETTKLLWTYSQLDDRVAPLVFVVRYWASLTRITARERPTNKFTNFQITVLVLCYLIRGTNPGLIPPLEEISKLVKFSDTQNEPESSISINSVGIDLINFRKKRLRTVSNQQDLGQLLAGFFEFYTKFDFASYSVSLSRDLKLKPEETPKSKIHLENPVECTLNAAKNVGHFELDAFVRWCDKSHALILSLDKQNTPGKLNYRLYDLFAELKNQPNSFSNSDLKSQESSRLADELNSAI